VGAVMADILPYLGVPKSYSPEETAGQEIRVEDYSDLTQIDAARKLKETGLVPEFLGTGETVTGQIPSPGEIIPGGSEVLLYLEEEPEVRTVTVPDFTGLHRQQAAETAGKLGLYLQITGNEGLSPNITVISQNVTKDTQVPVGTTITLKFTDKTARD
jgi:stage V sporulation protein D (sporulation-specific penicillin-binding protein)